MKKLNIVIDFDLTIAVSNYPTIIRQMYGAKETINYWHEIGHTIIIGTCRAGQYAEDAKQWLVDNGIHFDYFNENNKDLIELYGTDTRKLSGCIYIDDKSLGGLPRWCDIRKMVDIEANKKPLIICVLGESGCGKTSLCEYIEQVYGVLMIQSYTDRPKRHESEEGHVFLDASEYDLLRRKDMIARTVFGQYRYCCLKQDVKMQNTYTIDESGWLMLLSKYRHKYNIVSIRVKCDMAIRELRVKNPERITRDIGKFTLPDNYFNFVLSTDDLEYHEYPIELDKFLHQVLHRGWTIT